MHVIEAQSASSGASRSLQYKQECAFRQGAITRDLGPWPHPRPEETLDS